MTWPGDVFLKLLWRVLYIGVECVKRGTHDKKRKHKSDMQVSECIIHYHGSILRLGPKTLAGVRYFDVRWLRDFTVTRLAYTYSHLFSPALRLADA